MARLYIRQDGVEQVFEIQDDLVSFGRSSENSIQVRDIKSSRKHCQIERTPTGWKLVDLESANGTSVNGQKVNHKMLEEGDVVAIGEVQIQFGEKPPALEPAAATVAMPSEVVPAADAASAAPAPVAPDPNRLSRLSVVRASHSTNPWLVRSLVAAAVLLIVGVIGTVAKNGYSEYQIAQAAERDYVALYDSVKSLGDVDAIKKLEAFVTAYPNSPRIAEVQDRIGKIRTSVARTSEALARLKDLKARAEQPDGDLAALREDFRVLLAQVQGSQLAERVSAEMRALDNRIAHQGSDAIAAMEKEAGDFLVRSEYGAAADVYKRFIALHAEDEMGKKAEAGLAQVLREAYETFDRLVTQANALLERGEYAAASDMLRDHLPRYAGTLPYYQAQLKLLGIEVLAKGESQSKEDAKIRQLREECFQLALKADDLVKIRRYGDARKAYDQILSRLNTPETAALHTLFTARAKDVLAEAALFDRLVAAINGATLAPNTYALSADFSGKMEKADQTAIDVRFPQGFTRVAWLSLKPAEMLEMYRRMKPKGDDLYTLAVFSYQHHLDKDAGKLLQEFVQALPDRKGDSDRCVARVRGIEVPTGGFIYHNAAWLTPDEHKYALLSDEVDTILAQVDRSNWKDVEKAFASFEKLYANNDLRRDFREGTRDRIRTSFEGKRKAACKKLAKLPQVVKREQLKALKEELNKRRKAALELIYNEEVYTYSTEKNDHGEKAQPDVDDLVKAVRDLWEHPMDLMVRLDKSVAAQIEDIKQTDKYVVALGGASAMGENSEYTDMLASVNQAMDLRSVTLDSTERQILEYNKKVRAFNANAGTDMSAQELRQAEINNDYREMMGRRILEVHKQLGASARKHSEWMVSTGVFSHDEDKPERKTPGDRMKQEGYSGPGGENICMGRGDPRGAFDAWYHSSGHHRNMLSDGWNHIGVGLTGMHWTQNFGNAASQVGGSSETTAGDGGNGNGDGGKSGAGTTTGGKTGPKTGGAGGPGTTTGGGTPAGGG